MKLFYIECEDKDEEDVLNELINNGYSKELTYNVYMINPKLNKNEEEELTTKLATCNNYSVYDNIAYYLDDNSYNEEIDIQSMYDIELKLEISEVLRETIFGNEFAFDELDDNIYYSENSWEKVWEYLNDFGRECLKNRLDDLMKNLETAQFKHD